MKIRFGTLSCVILLFTTAAVLAGPSLPITKPWVMDTNILSGPAVDPAAIRGQWFYDYATGTETNRTHEFYDNFLSGFMGVNAITGYVSSITYVMGPGTPILAFSIQATVWNDNTPVAAYQSGTNSHGESLLYVEPLYTDTLYQVKLTASFAVTDVTNLPGPPPIGPYPPYLDQQPYIEATNEDQAAWYCWSPESFEAPTGNYFVPTWDFGDIPPGQSSTRQLDFIVPSTLLPTDARYMVIVQSQATMADILLNRSTSLKISTWMDTIGLDTGIPYPEEPFRGSDVSVFHNIPEEEEEQLDFGDAQDPSYPTLWASTGACHTIVPGVMLGSAIDAEGDGQPTFNADGDDINPPAGADDEDGVILPSLFVAGASPQISVTASTAGFLDAWIDWDSNGDWAGANEQVFVHQALTAGVNNLVIAVPPAVVPGGPHSRWRFTTNALLAVKYDGWIDHGEVEDYEVRLDVLDFGDAPDPTYPTLLVNDGARHRIPTGYWLGPTAPDSDPDGLPTSAADGDDLANLPDEDGVSLGAALVRGQMSPAIIIASTNGWLDAWIDFNADGDWADAGENISPAAPLLPAANPFNITVPATAALGPTFARFRFSSAGGLSYTGAASNGEVEDYQFTIYQQSPDTNTFFITNITRGASSARIEWGGGTGTTYETQYTLDLLSTASPPWTVLGAQVTGAPLSQTDTNAVETFKFYRVVAPYAPPPP